MKRMYYEDWNDLIAQKFFSKEMAGKEVLLYVTKDVLDQVGRDTGEDFHDFIRCIKEGPADSARQGICQKALWCYEDWRNTRQGYPQYIAYLAFFVLAATTGGDFDPKAYYPRLRTLLGETPKTGTYPSFDKMDKLWDDLEKWSRINKHEELGRYSKRIRGGNIHVGLPFSQTILSEDERKALPQIFSEAEIDPTDPPSELAIGRILLRYGSEKLERRTLQLLKNDERAIFEMRNALIDFIFEELSEWDGCILETWSPDTLEESGRIAKARLPSVGLRICLDPPDRVAKKITSSLRFKTIRPFPDSGLDFEHKGKAYSCFETIPNWSTKLKNSETGLYLDATELDWLSGVKFKDEEKSWRAVLKGAAVRLFLPGHRDDLPGWIESQHLERECRFFVACHSSMERTISDWGSNSCNEFAITCFQGLPLDWLLFEGEGAYEPCREVDVLNIPNLLRMRLHGGIKVGRGNYYLKFGPPHIVLDGGQGDEHIIIVCNQYTCELRRENLSMPIWTIPQDVPIGKPLELGVYRDGNEPLACKVIQLIEPEILDKFDSTPKRCRSGIINADNDSEIYATGAVVMGCDQLVKGSFSQTLPTYLSKRIIFIGARPGQIVDWPEENLPSDWNPVWAISKFPRSGKEKWKVHFCGHWNQDRKNANFYPGTPLAEHRHVKRWKEAIWVKRNRIEEPNLKVLRQLWVKYKEVAGHA